MSSNPKVEYFERLMDALNRRDEKTLQEVIEIYKLNRLNVNDVPAACVEKYSKDYFLFKADALPLLKAIDMGYLENIEIILKAGGDILRARPKENVTLEQLQARFPNIISFISGFVVSNSLRMILAAGAQEQRNAVNNFIGVPGAVEAYERLVEHVMRWLDDDANDLKSDPSKKPKPK